MIIERKFKSPIVHKMAENEFKDTSSSDGLDAVYGHIDDIKGYLDEVIDMVCSCRQSEDSEYLLDKLRKVRKYMGGIAFYPGCYDSEGDYYGTESSPRYKGCLADDGIYCPPGCDVSDAGGYPDAECIVTSE